MSAGWSEACLAAVVLRSGTKRSVGVPEFLSANPFAMDLHARENGIRQRSATRPCMTSTHAAASGEWKGVD